MQCTMGIFASTFSSICSIDFSEIMDASLGLGTPEWFAALEPPSITIPIGEMCYTAGVDNGEFFHRGGDGNFFTKLTVITAAESLGLGWDVNFFAGLLID